MAGLAYVLFASSWLLFADRFVALWIPGSSRVYTDLLFVALSAVCLFLVLRPRFASRPASLEAERLRRVSAEFLDAITDGFVALDKDWYYTYVNRRGAEMAGRHATDMVGKHLWTEFPQLVASGFQRICERAMAEQLPSLFEEYHVGWSRWFEGHVYPTPDTLYIFFQDVTDRKRADLWRTGYNEVLKALVAGRPLSAVLATAVRVIEPQTQGATGSVLLLDSEGPRLRLAAAPNLPDGLNRALQDIPIGPAEGACGTAAFTREFTVVEDFQTDPRGEKYRDLARQFSLRACWSHPIVSADGDVLGTFAMYHDEPRSPDAAERRLVEDASRLVALAIETARTRADLQTSEERFRHTVEHAPVGIALVDLDGQFIRINRKVCDILGYSRAELLAMRFHDVTHPDDQQRSVDRFEQAQAGRLPAYSLEKRYSRADGETVWINLTHSLVRKSDGTPDYFIAIIEDISHRRHIEQRLRETGLELELLSHRVLAAQEDERHRIARELHDEIGQLLTAIKFKLQAVVSRGVSPEVVAALNEGMASIDRVAVSVRDLSLDLRPSMLDHLGLGPTVHWFVARQRQLLGIDVSLSLPPEELPRPASEIETACFRILQEAFTNAARHANAKHMQVSLKETPDTVELTVSDDGRGFNLAEARRRMLEGGGAGLLGMTERAEIIGGTVTIASSLGFGTTVTARFSRCAQVRRPERTADSVPLAEGL